MADIENSNDTPAAEGTEPAPSEANEEAPQPAAKKAAVKKSAKKAAPRKKAAEDAPEIQVRPSASRTASGESRNVRPAPPKSFWWRALLMVTVVVFLFSIIRGMANRADAELAASRQQPGELIPAIPGETAGGGSVIVEEAPSQPRAEIGTPAAGYYGYPSPPPQSYYYAQPAPGSAAPPARQPAYPTSPQGGYAYPYPQQHPWYPPYPMAPQGGYAYPQQRPWYPPYGTVWTPYAPPGYPPAPPRQ